MQVSSTQNKYGETYRLIINGRSLHKIHANTFEANLSDVSDVELKDLPLNVNLYFLNPHEITISAGTISSLGSGGAVVVAKYDQCPETLKTRVSFDTYVHAADLLIQRKADSSSSVRYLGIVPRKDTDHLATVCEFTVEATTVGEACELAVRWYDEIQARLDQMSSGVEDFPTSAAH